MTPDSLTLAYTRDGTDIRVEFSRLAGTDSYTRTEYEVVDDGSEHRVIGTEQVQSLDVDARVPAVPDE